MMVQLVGMLVSLTTATDNSEAGTRDHLYIGVAGFGGGREFPLRAGGQGDDFNPGIEKFVLGLVWEGGPIGDAKFPLRSEPGQDNDPALTAVDMDRLFTVYLKKQGDNSNDEDDAYRLKDLEVLLYGPEPSKRTYRFGRSDPVWLGNEHGHVIYLEQILENAPPG